MLCNLLTRLFLFLTLGGFYKLPPYIFAKLHLFFLTCKLIVQILSSYPMNYPLRGPCGNVKQTVIVQ